MASQAAALRGETSRGKRLAEIRSLAPRLRYLKQQQKEEAFQERQYDLQKESFEEQKRQALLQQKQREKEQRTSLGLSTMGMGANVLQSGLGKDVGTNLFGKWAPGGAGGLIGSGLLGFGAGTAFGDKKSKGKNALIGGLAGGLGGILSSLGGNILTGGLSGLLSGGLGGVLSSFI